MSTQKQVFRDDQLLGKVYDSQIFARLWQYVRPHLRWLLLSFLLIPVVTLAELAQPVLILLAIDDYIMKGTTDGLGILALGYVGLVLAQTLLSFLQTYVLQYAGQLATTDLRIALHKHILSRSASFFDHTPVGRIVTRVTGDIDNIQEMFASGLVTIVADAFKLIGIVAILLWVDARLALLTFLVIPLLVVVVEYFRRQMRHSFRSVRKKIAELNTHLQEHVTGMKVVQLFAKERQVAKEFEAINGEHQEATLDVIKADASLYAIVESLASISMAIILWYGGGKLVQGMITIGVLVLFLDYMKKFFIPVRDLSAKWGLLQSAMASAERIITLLDVTDEDAPKKDVGVGVGASAKDSGQSVIDEDARKKDVSVGAAARDSGQSVIDFRNVTFAYNEGDPVLHDVNLSVARGQTVAVVGATGSGKSTLVKLLSRLYDPDHGQIDLFGRNVQSFDKHQLRNHVTVIPQDVFMFSGTVRENIELGAQHATAEQIDAAIARVGFDKVLARRVDGLDSQIMERSANFSAGERQLMAFARALAKNPDVLVLDEATASVDPEAEAWIEQALAKLMKGRTCLVIAHRLSTIRRADLIVVMQRGRIVERGTHEQLTALGGKYAKLYELSQQTALRAAG